MTTPYAPPILIGHNEKSAHKEGNYFRVKSMGMHSVYLILLCTWALDFLREKCLSQSSEMSFTNSDILGGVTYWAGWHTEWGDTLGRVTYWVGWHTRWLETYAGFDGACFLIHSCRFCSASSLKFWLSLRAAGEWLLVLVLVVGAGGLTEVDGGKVLFCVRLLGAGLGAENDMVVEGDKVRSTNREC